MTHASNVTVDETWAGAGTTHSIPNDIIIGAAAKVTVQPCAIVSIAPGASIVVNGTAQLIAAGTGPAGIVSFVRANPASAWGALRGNTSTSLIDLTWAVLQGAGGLAGQGNNSAITVAGPAYGVTPVPVLRVNNVTIDSPQGGGIYLDASAAFTSDSTALTIRGAPDYVLSATIMAVESIPPGSYADPSNDHGFVDIIGPNVIVFSDLTIHNYLPVRIKSAIMTVRAPSGTSPVTLTVEAGAQIRFARLVAQPGALVEFGTAGGAPNNQVGVLVAQGTAAAPILFTSDESAPVPGDWFGLWLATSPGSQLDHVVIEYAGSTSGAMSSNNCRPVGTPDAAALFVGGFDTQYLPPANLLTNSTIRFSQGFGIDAVWQAATFNAPNLTAGNSFQSNALCAQTFNGLIPPTPCGANVGCTAP